MQWHRVACFVWVFSYFDKHSVSFFCFRLSICMSASVIRMIGFGFANEKEVGGVALVTKFSGRWSLFGLSFFDDSIGEENGRLWLIK